ncbi:hypothetical protein [Neolewinella sp.]|uniref:hypothetical protein n=1 Tax=Neolewinella sp. TaxID=2993543 RepID=UPI003B52AAB9
MSTQRDLADAADGMTYVNDVTVRVLDYVYLAAFLRNRFTELYGLTILLFSQDAALSVGLTDNEVVSDGGGY